MTRRSFLLHAGLAATGKGARAASTPNPLKFVTTKDAAYQLGRVEHVLARDVLGLTPAPSGRWVLFSQILRPEETDDVPRTYGEVKLWLYDAHRKKLTLLFRVQDDPEAKTHSRFDDIRWFPDTPKAIVPFVTTRSLVHGYQVLTTRFGFVDAERGVFRTLNLPPSQSGAASHVRSLFLKGTSADRQSVLFQTGDNETQLSPYYAIRIRDGQVTPLNALPKDRLTSDSLPKKDPLPLDLHEEEARLTSEAGRKVHTTTLWLTPTQPRPGKRFVHAFVTAEADSSSVLLPDLSAVLFTREGALYSTSLTHLSSAAFDKVQQDLAVESALEIGCVVLGDALDQATTLPDDLPRITKRLLAEVEDTEAVRAFVFTYKGSLDRNKITNEKETALGYLPAPGGRAVFFMDRHVEWEPVFRIVPPSDGG